MRSPTSTGRYWISCVLALLVVATALGNERVELARDTAPEQSMQAAEGLMTHAKYAQYLQRFNSGDDRYAEIYDKDVVFDHGPVYGVLKGRQAIVDFYRDIRTQLQETVTATAVIIDNENSLMAVELTTRLEATKDGVTLPSRTLNKGETFITRGVVIYGLDKGRIVSIRGAARSTSFEPAKK